MKKGSGRPKLTLINVLKMDILMSNTKYNFPPGLLPRGGSKGLCLGEVPRHYKKKKKTIIIRTEV